MKVPDSITGLTANPSTEEAAQPMDEVGHDALLQRIRALSFPAYCHLIRLLLYRSGYTSVQIVEPGTGQLSGQLPVNPLSTGAPAFSAETRRLLYSGLLAVSHTDLASALTLVRVKQAQGAPVSRRFVDQLRGAMLRLGAEQGMLIATGRFSRYAKASASQTPLPPVRLMDGEILCAMLRERGLGVRKTPDSQERDAKKPDAIKQGSGSIDEPFFQLLEKQAQRQRPKLQNPKPRSQKRSSDQHLNPA